MGLRRCRTPGVRGLYVRMRMVSSLRSGGFAKGLSKLEIGIDEVGEDSTAVA